MDLQPSSPDERPSRARRYRTTAGPEISTTTILVRLTQGLMRENRADRLATAKVIVNAVRLLQEGDTDQATDLLVVEGKRLVATILRECEEDVGPEART